MRCPNCKNRVAPFSKWLFWPGPRRTCLSCGSRLRYKNFWGALGLHVLLVTVWAAFHYPLWGLVGVLVVTAFVFPWFFARYESAA
jgi:Flp pilus assembly protein TadB